MFSKQLRRNGDQDVRVNDDNLDLLCYLKNITKPNKNKAINSPITSHESKSNPMKSPLYTPL